MANKKSFFQRYRFVYRRSSIFVKCALLVAIVGSVAALTVLRINIDLENQRLDALRVQAAQQEQTNTELDTMTQQKDTEDGIRTIAQVELDMVDGDTVFYDVVTNQD